MAGILYVILILGFGIKILYNEDKEKGRTSYRSEVEKNKSVKMKDEQN